MALEGNMINTCAQGNKELQSRKKTKFFRNTHFLFFYVYKISILRSKFFTFAEL